MIEVFLAVVTLIWDVRRIVDNDIEGRIPEGNVPVVGDDIGIVLGIDIQSDDSAGAPSPKPADVDGCVQYLTGASPRIKFQHFFEQFTIRTAPDRRERLVSSPRTLPVSE